MKKNTNIFRLQQLTVSMVVTIACLIFSRAAYPCDVPVFRYALELWPQDPYQVLVLYQNALDSAASAKVKTLAAEATLVAGDTVGLGDYPHQKNSINFKLMLIKTADTVNPGIRHLLHSLNIPRFPFCVVLFPVRSRNPEPLFAGPLDLMPCDTLFDSPARHAVASSICSGMSGLWVLIGSGNRSKDSAAGKVLASGINKCKETLKLRDPDEGETKKVVEMSDIPLKIDFARISISRTDPRERYFIEMLEKTEPALKKLSNQPIAFCIFARGRTLYALAGQGINENNIMEAGSFVTGPCACTIKDQNPGTDILMSFDWIGALSRKVANEDQNQAALPSIDAMVPVKPKAAGPQAKPALPREAHDDSRPVVTKKTSPACAIHERTDSLPNEVGQIHATADTAPLVKNPGVIVRTEAAAVRKAKTSSAYVKFLIMPVMVFAFLGVGVLGIMSLVLVKRGKKK